MLEMGKVHKLYIAAHCESDVIGTKPRKLIYTLLAVSPFRAILSAPTTGKGRHMSNSMRRARVIGEWKEGSRTYSMDLVVLEKRSDHCVADYGRRDLECLEL